MSDESESGGGSSTPTDVDPNEPFLGRKEGREITTGVLTAVLGVVAVALIAWIGGQLIRLGGESEGDARNASSDQDASEAIDDVSPDPSTGDSVEDSRIEVRLPHEFTFTEVKVTFEELICTDYEVVRECRLAIRIRNDGDTRQGLPNGYFEIFVSDDHYFGQDSSDYVFPGEEGTAEVVFEVPPRSTPSSIEVDFYDTLGDEDPLSLNVVL